MHMVCDAFDSVDNMREGQPLPYDLTGRIKQFQHKRALKKSIGNFLCFLLFVYIFTCVHVCKKRTRGGEFCFLREGEPLPYGVGEYQPIYSVTLNSGRQGCRPLLKKDNKMLSLDAEIFECLCKWKQHKFVKFTINTFAC